MPPLATPAEHGLNRASLPHHGGGIYYFPPLGGGTKREGDEWAHSLFWLSFPNSMGRAFSMLGNGIAIGIGIETV